MMKIKKVQAASVREALAEIREQFGPDAVILHTKQLTTKMSGADRAKVEVTAGIDEQPAPEPEQYQRRTILQPKSQETNNELNQQMTRMQELIRHLTEELQYPDVQNLPLAYRELYLHLVQQEIEPKTARELIKETRDVLGDSPRNVAVTDKVQELIEAELAPAWERGFSGRNNRILTFVGPTGVGKTTTIAKLATQKSVEEGRSVALITADTFRVAAADQLRIFADLLDLPLEIVYTPTEMKRAIEKFSRYDYIYIDTTGRSQKDTENLHAINRMIKAANADEIHLLLSASTSRGTLLKAAEEFSLFNITDVLVTKMDEAETVGSLYSLFRNYQWPISYFTNGQNVPEDIFVASATAYCNLLLGALNE